LVRLIPSVMNTTVYPALFLHLLFFLAFQGTALENSWTKPTSGYWEEPYWSLGTLPSDGQSVVFTNAGWKALAIGSSTTTRFPESLRIEHLSIGAPPDSQNLLLLNYAGLFVPLNARSISVGTNGSLLSYYSAIEAEALTVSGTATFAEYGQSRFNAVEVGSSQPGVLNLSNGWFSVGYALEISKRAQGTVNQYGGSNVVGAIVISKDGVYNFNDGWLNAGNIYITPDQPGPARLNIAGGLVNVRASLYLGGFEIWEDPREVLLSGGLFKSPAIAGYNGRFTQTGGTNQTTHIDLSGTGMTHAQYLLRTGRVDSSTLVLGRPGYEGGNFTQFGGVHSNSHSIVAHGHSESGGHYVSGSYTLRAGVLFTPGIGLAGGRFEQLGGTNYVEKLSLTNGGSYDLSGTGVLISARTDMENYAVPAVRPWFFQSGGEHRTPVLRLESGGVYDLYGGVLAANNISVRAGTRLRLDRGVVSSNGLIEINGGTVFLNGNHDLGWLRFNGIGHIDFLYNGSSIVRFTKVGYPPGALDGELVIHNWKGSTQSPGRDQMYITEPDEYTHMRVKAMKFIDPAGYPAGTYRARMKGSGEIVPLEPGYLDFKRYQGGLVLRWHDGYQLFTATNVAGPYAPVPHAAREHYVPFTEAKRFFTLRPSE
jgi:hypothetical protein